MEKGGELQYKSDEEDDDANPYDSEEEDCLDVNPGFLGPKMQRMLLRRSLEGKSRCLRRELGPFMDPAAAERWSRCIEIKTITGRRLQQAHGMMSS